MEHANKRKLTSRRKRSKWLLRLLCITFIILLLAAVGILWFISNTATSASAVSNAATSDATQKMVEIKNLIIQIVEKDVRTVKNTATEESHKTDGLAICMYHYVYDKDDPPQKINNNYIEVDALEEELKYLVENEYFFPTWEEVRQYIDGELLLPEKSIVLTFDDGSRNFLELGAPLFDKYQIPVTSFLITKNDGEDKVAEYESDYVTFQSHSHDMHRAGGTIGHGGIFTALPHDEALADLQESIRICKNGEAFAYPYGDYTDACVQVLEEAGFLCGVTTHNGRVYPGDNPLLLNRVRMTHNQSLNEFIYMVE